jgi:DNA gyrase subunit A
MVCVQQASTTLLVVSENGYGKRSEMEDYRVTNRGGKGVRTLNITDKTGKLVALQAVEDSDDLMIINKSGVAIRIGVESLRVMGRATQGVRLIRLDCVSNLQTKREQPPETPKIKDNKPMNPP